MNEQDKHMTELHMLIFPLGSKVGDNADSRMLYLVNIMKPYFMSRYYFIYVRNFSDDNIIPPLNNHCIQKFGKEREYTRAFESSL